MGSLCVIICLQTKQSQESNCVRHDALLASNLAVIIDQAYPEQERS